MPAAAPRKRTDRRLLLPAAWRCGRPAGAEVRQVPPGAWIRAGRRHDPLPGLSSQGPDPAGRGSSGYADRARVRSPATALRRARFGLSRARRAARAGGVAGRCGGMDSRRDDRRATRGQTAPAFGDLQQCPAVLGASGGLGGRTRQRTSVGGRFPRRVQRQPALRIAHRSRRPAERSARATDRRRCGPGGHGRRLLRDRRLATASPTAE